jgi:4,5-dihydroxyphthalate decarboxylase
MSFKIKMTLASGDYDRVRPLWDGGIKAEGLDLNVILLPVEEIFFRMARYREFDAAEFSFSSFLISRSRGAPRFVAIPVFPSRKFRHADVYIHSDSRIKAPQDLKGGRIGVPEYQITAAVWMRGILQEFYGVDAIEVHWFTGGTETPGREERLKLTLPPPFKKTAIPGNTTLFDLLRKGELDAVFTARVPTPFLRGEKWIKRLFPDFKAVERDYFQKTGIFPIMHLVVLNEDYYEAYHWSAQSLFKAYCQSKELCFERHLSAAALPVSLPWFSMEMESTFEIMGQDFWPYGVERNKDAIATLVRYMKEQGLLPEDFDSTVEDLFAPSTLAAFGV